MNEFGKRTDEELAAVLYSRGKPEPKPQPAAVPEPDSVATEEPEAEVEESDKEVDWELEETPDGKGLQPKGADLVTGNDRLMTFLENDIEAMEREQEAEDRRIEDRRKTTR